MSSDVLTTAVVNAFLDVGFAAVIWIRLNRIIVARFDRREESLGSDLNQIALAVAISTALGPRYLPWRRSAD